MSPVRSNRTLSAKFMEADYISPSLGKVTFNKMLEHIAQYVLEDPEQDYHLIVGTDSQLTDRTNFITAIIIHRVGHGGRYFYRKMVDRKMESLRQRIMYEASKSLETAGQITAELAKNGYSELPVEIHLDVGPEGDTKRLIREVVGMVVGSGYQARIKPEAFGASHIADHHVR